MTMFRSLLGIVIVVLSSTAVVAEDAVGSSRGRDDRQMSAEDSEKQKIEAALARIETSPFKFIRNDDEHDGKSAAEHLRRKLKSAGDKVKTFDQFIEHIATRSSMSGDPYLVKLGDGKTVELAKWLRETAPTPGHK
jgi:hypothetical protein